MNPVLIAILKAAALAALTQAATAIAETLSSKD